MQKNNSIIQEKLIRYTSEMVAVTRLEKDGGREGREEEGGGGGGSTKKIFSRSARARVCVPGSRRRVNSLYKQQCKDLETAVVQGVECKTFT